MAAASISSTVTAPVAKPTQTGVSRDDLEINDVVLLNSANVGTAYAWSLAYVPEGSAAAFSGSPLAQSPGSFTVDKEGSYLVWLQFTDGTGISEQFVRLRALTEFGSLKLVAAGERVDTVPVPVDTSFAGWADEQNGNLLILLGLIQQAAVSGNLLFVDPVEGQYQTIQDAINYAQAQAPTSVSPWVVMVRPGTYTEDLTLYPWVHVFGWPGGQKTALVRIVNDTVTHTVNLGIATDQLSLANLYFERMDASGTPLLQTSGAGLLELVKCVFLLSGAGAPQGPCINLTGTSQVNVYGSRFSAASVTSVDTYVIEAATGTSLALKNCELTLRGIKANDGSTVLMRDSTIDATGATYGIVSDADSLIIEYCVIENATSQDVAFNPTGAVVAGPISGEIRWSKIGDLIFDTTNVAGATSLELGSIQHGTLTFPGGVPATYEATVLSSTLFFDNVVTGITAENVQDALDEIWGLAVAVRTLDDAYDGGGGGPGTGRTIIADSGAVQIVDAAAPSDPIPLSNTDGNLEVVGSIKTGAINKPEQIFDPNPFGSGPHILLGREIWSGSPLGSSAFIMGNASGNPTFHNYNLRVGTYSADGGLFVGNLSLQGGDALSNIDAASVFIQAGLAADGAGGDGGAVYLAAGDSAAGVKGYITLVRQEDATPATLTAAGAFVGGVAGTVRFATNQGAIEVDLLAGDNLAAALIKLSASGQVTAVDSGGGVIQLTTTTTGPLAEVYFLNADAGLDAALGVFSGQVMTQGTWPSYFELEVSAANELTFGPNGATGPMIYNADTGKLTVPGLIDPTGLVFTEDAPPVTGAAEGAVFVGNGAGGTVVNHLYYREANNGALLDISAASSASAGIREVVATPDAVTATDKILLVNVGGAATLNLPDITTYTGPGLRIKDLAGIAAVSNITVNAFAGQTIDGAASVILSVAYAAIDLVPYGTNWSIF